MIMINQNFPRIEKAIKLVENNNVILMSYPIAFVHSLDETKIYKVDYVNKECQCEDKKFNGVSRCQHIFASQIKAGVYSLPIRRS